MRHPHDGCQPTGRRHPRPHAVILRPDDFELWLESDIRVVSDLQRLLTPYGGGDLEAYPVTRAVGNPRAEGPELIEPIGQ